MAGFLQMLTIRCFDDTYVELLNVPLLPCPDLPAAWTSRGVHIDIPHFATQNPTLSLKPVIYSDRLISLARFCHSEYYQSGCKEIAARKSHPNCSLCTTSFDSLPAWTMLSTFVREVLPFMALLSERAFVRPRGFQ